MKLRALFAPFEVASAFALFEEASDFCVVRRGECFVVYSEMHSEAEWHEDKNIAQLYHTVVAESVPSRLGAAMA